MTATLIYSESIVPYPHLHFLLIQRNAVGQNPILFKVYKLLLFFRIFEKKIITYFSSLQHLIYSPDVTFFHFSHLRSIRQEDQILKFISDTLVPSSFLYPNVPLSEFS